MAKKKVEDVEVNSSELSFLLRPNIVHALAYIPYGIGAVSMYFLHRVEKKAAMHHIKYSGFLAIGAIFLMIILNSFFSSIVTLVYLVGSGFLAYKAYNNEKIQIEILDTIDEKISNR